MPLFCTSKTESFLRKKLSVFETRKSDVLCVSLACGVIVTSMNQTQSNLAKALSGQSTPSKRSLPSVLSVLSAPSAKSLRTTQKIVLATSLTFWPCKSAQALDTSDKLDDSQRSQVEQVHPSKSRSKPTFSHYSCRGPAWLTNEEKWSIAEAHVDKFFEMDTNAVAELFGCRDYEDSKFDIQLDEQLDLKIFKYRHSNEFCFLPHRKIPPGYVATGPYDGGSNFPEVPSEAIWTSAKRKDEKDYWTIIKANLDKFIGMTSEELVARLGPERESSKPWNYCQYRVGDAGLMFYLKNGKVEKFKFESNKYIPGT